MKFKQILIVSILGILTLFTSQIKAQDTSKVTPSVVYKDAKEAIKNNGEKLEKAIGTIAKDLKVTANQVWDILVKQQKVWSYCFLLLTISALVNWYIWYRHNFAYKNIEYEKGVKETMIENPSYNSYRGDAKRVIGSTEEILIPKFPASSIKWFKYLHLAICLTLSLFSYLHFADMLTGFINPEYGAMKTIAQVAQSLR